MQGTWNSIVVVPAMHRDMMENPVNKENIEKLKKHGVLVVEINQERMYEHLFTMEKNAIFGGYE